MISNPTPKFKKHFFLDLAKSGRSGQYLTGTGSGKKLPDRPEPKLEPDFRSHTAEKEYEKSPRESYITHSFLLKQRSLEVTPRDILTNYQ